MKRTGWEAGLLQDDSRELSEETEAPFHLKDGTPVPNSWPMPDQLKE
jgi:hypothetical protein